MSDNSINGKSTNPTTQEFGIRKFGRVNWLGLYTLYRKEVMRFMSIYLQTIIAPVVSMMLFLAIFTISIGKFRAEINGIEFIVFIVPGLIMNAMMQNAFANNSSSLMMGKMQGNIVDILMPPISAGEMMFAITMGGATRGFVVGITTGIVMAFVVDIEIQHFAMVFLFGILGSMVMALLGLLGGLWADKFDQMGMITNFVITPLTFLSGTFYSIKQLPEFAQIITRFNPFFYLIDGFRFGFIGHSESNIYLTILVSVGTCVVLWIWGFYLIKVGYKIKS
ncbi:MAG: ABC transporter permease [Hyphomicrobiales bacterium]